MTESITNASLDALTPLVERADKLRLLMLLIERATNLKVAREYLKNRGLQFSAGSWEELRTKRVMPAYDEGKLSLADLQTLLRRTEGFGRQHVFLFKCSEERAKLLLSKDRIHRILIEKQIDKIFTDPLLVDLPNSPTVVDVQFFQREGEELLSIKEVEKRTYKKLSSQVIDESAKTLTKVYKYETQRAINFARLWSNGLLEIRIASKDNSTQYKEELAQFKLRLHKFFSASEFVELSLENLKKNLWSKRVELKDIVKFSTYTLRDDEGMILSANTVLTRDDLAGSVRVANSLAEFEAEDVFCTDSNVYFKIPESDGGINEIHVLLNGEDNEFAITAAITEEEYEYVLQQVLEYN